MADKIVTQKKYLVFAGTNDEGYVSDEISNLIGEMAIEDAYRAISQNADEVGIIAIIHQGVVKERAEFFKDVEYTTVGKSTQGGFVFADDNKVYLENGVIPYTVSWGDLESIAKEAINHEGGVFERFDFSGNGSLYSTYLEREVWSGFDPDLLFGSRESIVKVLTISVIGSYTRHRDWLAKGSPTFKATGVW